ncbi:tRNA lysidine(34) synthetase TilS [Aeromicrobium chenweiae]|uniref:tRNA(Ile)-lysidine synthase n=1 Tax=Aeromicrobium chenweiae TaxID=2079793 RepID=A0A2S0WQM5_9ACTN|nr:tRNA lysidine(34) synthetase TilS [Aeromicrobium chenweiae]AWB93590.1 tRNA lysidine(34) synthetase TilS [Aeromicrobium chenweiae]TGN33239.1 tRNA lysidine(34) synthetase TilS [Aeromicrobium chenweiae]
MGGALDPAVATGRNEVRRALADLGSGSRLVVGVSGGADSLALAAVTAFVASREAWSLRAVVVDHGLQTGSPEVAATAAAQLGTLGVDAEVVAVEVGTGGGPEAAARTARLCALAAAAQRADADAVLLAHTLDDQAETVLLGLGRGSGPRSIAGMVGRDGLWRRPFLTLRRADTEQICRASGLSWWVDPHNSDPAYRRSRIRTEVMPVLEDVLGGGVAAALARTADQLRADNDLLDDLAAQVGDPHDVRALASLPPALRSRVLRRAALAAGADPAALGAVHLAGLDRLVTDWHGQLRIELPGGVSAGRRGPSLTFIATPVGQ